MSFSLDDISKFFKLNWRNRLLFSEAFFLSGLIRLAILTIPFRFLARLLGRQNINRKLKHTRNSKEKIEIILWAIETVSGRTPWKSTCLVQAICGKIMLKIRKQKSTLFLGVAKDDRQGIKTHAWLSAGDTTFLKTANPDEYTIVASFSDEIP